MIYNGVLQEWQPSEDVYIYQNIHTLDYKAWHLKQHLEIINISAQTLFAVDTNFSVQEIKSQIELLLDHSRLSRNVSICVVMRLYSTGDYSLHVEQVGIYRGYVMRSLRPIVTCIKMDVGMSNYPTSALKASYDLAHHIAIAAGYHEAIMIDSAGYVVEDPLRPVAVIKEYTITIPSPNLYSVESLLMERAAKRHGLQIRHGKISLQDIEAADEVLMMTHQGITSVNQIADKIYYSTLADKIAHNLEYNDLKD